jgi:cystathionine beta-lyase/cystathionine gamma-synthase
MSRPQEQGGSAGEGGGKPPPPHRFETRAIHAGAELNRTSALAPPIFQSSTFKLESARQGAELTQAAAPAEFYTRWGNPTTKQLEAILADLEGAEAALAFASGMGAISTALLSLLSAGDHVLIGQSIYSGVNELARGVLPRFGIEVSFADSSDTHAVAAALRPETRLVLVESPTNPTLGLCDLEALGKLGRERGVLTMVDNTFATPANQNPIGLGIDIVAHAATKAIGGHSDVTAGAICSRRDIVERCWRHLKLFGASLSPFEAWLIIRGLKTLSLRVEKQSRSALALARFLESHPDVERVYYPGLPSHPGHALACRQMRGFGGILSFELRGGVQRGVRFVEALRLVQLAVSLGGAESLIQHPASMTHGTLGEDELRKAGISPGLLRLSVGLEAAEDLQEDLAQALRVSRG